MTMDRARNITLLLVAVQVCASGSWEYFDTTNSPLYGNSIGPLGADAAGNLYVLGSAAMLWTYDGDSWDSIPTGVSPQAFALKMLVEPNGTVWVGTFYAGLIRIDSGTPIHLDSAALPCLPCRRAMPLGVDTAGLAIVANEWVPTNAFSLCGLLRIGVGSCDTVAVGSHQYLDESISGYARSTDGTEYVVLGGCTDIGGPVSLYSIGPDSLSEVEYIGGNCQGILHTGASAVYFSTAGSGGLGAVSPGGAIRYIDTVSGYSLNGVRCMFTASDGALWIGTGTVGPTYEGNPGLVRMTTGDTTVYNGDNSDFRHCYIQSISETTDGRMWVATDRHGLAAYTSDSAEAESAGPGHSMTVASVADLNGQQYFDLTGRTVHPARAVSGLMVRYSDKDAVLVVGAVRPEPLQ